ncbi:receptor-like serine/threonine-protein kinase SD1-7 [Curcuma longa]|uniref:receptor-like serine/threonine-protein kinase SD1-7 n=1 Tax=Curcuma longa TaxID=136217 RepID=UPI003D9E7448
MNPKLVLTESLSILSLLFMLAGRKAALAETPVMEDCEPKSCGDGRNITYPFWLEGQQESYCGYSSFRITCKNNSYTPVMTFIDRDFYVINIFYDNRSLILTSAEFVDLPCPLPYTNLTRDTTFYPLSVSPLNTEVYFLLNCSDHRNLTEHGVSPMDCQPNAYFGGEYDYDRFRSQRDFADAGCTLYIEPAFNYSGDDSFNETLAKGWLLSWSAVDCDPCLQSGGRCGFNETTSTFMCICADGVHANTCESSTSKRKELVLAITIPLLLGFFLLCCVIAVVRMKRNRAAKSIVNDSEDSLLQNPGVDLINMGILPSYDLSTIKAATNDFSDENKLGEGGFGVVYKGQLQDGKKIAVKKLSRYSSQGPNEFQNELSLIAKLQHRNLVRLLGSCIEGDERLIILEYMENKSLDTFIYDKTRSPLLNWQKRLEIITGIARGLLYLHQDSLLRIIHRDLKPSNILLDKDMIPKISDFGIARIFEGDGALENATTRPIGTIGYMAPEYLNEGIFSFKSDVFSFGVIVLEILSGQRNRIINHTDASMNLLGHAYRLWKEDRSLEILDNALDCSYPTTEILRCIRMSLLCVQDNVEDRPTMAEIVMMLTSEDQLQTPFKQPTIISTIGEERFTVNEMSLTITGR